MKFDSDFKKALQLLPEVEKDKLILRLLKRDLDLANKLRFELADTDSVKDKREMLENTIHQRITLISERYTSPGYLLMDLRMLSGEINNHVLITKDKYGEISLNCLMLKLMLKLNNKLLSSETPAKTYTLNIYIVARIYKIFMLIQKQHIDLHFDFKEDIETIGILMGENHNLIKTAIYNNLDVNWLTRFEIPDDIAFKYKVLRENGFLK